MLVFIRVKWDRVVEAKPAGEASGKAIITRFGQKMRANRPPVPT